MLGLCYKRLQVVVAPSCCSIAAAVDSLNQFHCFQKGPLFSSWFSSKSLLLGGVQTDDDKAQSFTVSYLIGSFGFSPELALSVTNKHKQRGLFTSPKKPDGVIKLLKDYGLSDAHISEIAKKCLELFLYDADKTLLPKLEFLSSIGISGNALARIFCSVPTVLTLSLERSLKPFYDISKALGIPEEKLPYFFISCGRMFNPQQLRNVARNVSILRANDVPESSFPLWVPRYAKPLSFESDKVKEFVNKVISMGFCPKSPKFMRALYVISVTDASKWEQKMKFYRKWGWTEDDVLSAFRKNPLFMDLSEKNFSSKFGFLVRKMGWQPAYVAETPTIFYSSLEKWIIPRCSVIRFLQLKGFIWEGKHTLSTMMTLGNKGFLDMFVIRYQEQAPELLSIFQGKISLAELGLGFEEGNEVKPM